MIHVSLAGLFYLTFDFATPDDSTYSSGPRHLALVTRHSWADLLFLIYGGYLGEFPELSFG